MSHYYLLPPTPISNTGLILHIKTEIYGNFITTNSPSISPSDANGRSSANPLAPNNPASAWPAWTLANPFLLNINQTGGSPYRSYSSSGVAITQFRGPGLANKITVAEAHPWEGGRGQRCDVWRALGVFVPQ